MFIRRMLSGLAGFFVGAMTGLFSGAVLGAAYYARLLSRFYAAGALVGLIFGFCLGAITHLLKGAYHGLTKGLKAGFFYYKQVDRNYFGIGRDNKELYQFINQLYDTKKPDLNLLNADEIKKFEAYLNQLQDQEQKEKLTEELSYYKKYIQKKCPLTRDSIQKHGDPVFIKVYDCDKKESIKVYERTSLLKEIKNNSYIDKETKDAETDCIIKAENVIAIGFHEKIIEFVAVVRKRISMNAALAKANLQPSDNEINKPQATIAISKEADAKIDEEGQQVGINLSSGDEKLAESTSSLRCARNG